MENAHDPLHQIPPAAGPANIVVVKSIYEIAPPVLEEFARWLEQRGLTTPLAQIVGFAQNQVRTAAPITTIETTTSTSYTDLATAGPSITGMPDGKYLILGSAVAKNSGAGSLSIVSASFNGSTAVDSDGAMTSDDQYSTCFFAVDKTLSNGGSNTVTMKYVVTAGTGSFRQRRLIALRYSN